MTRHAALLLSCVALLSCRNRPENGADDGGVDDGANINTVVQCGSAPPVGPGNSNELQRHVLDTAAFPDARCNDGTPATLYFRPFRGAANRNKWVLNLHGGGSCSSGPSCLARWCNCDKASDCPYAEKTTFFSRSTMTNDGPTTKKGDGVFLRGDASRPNPFGDYNQVEFQYCTSDSWVGARRSVEFSTVNPRTNAPVTFTMHFLGSKVLDADLSTLRQDGAPALVYTLGGGSTPLPDLDDATEVVVTGDSAGGSGTISNLDYIAELLRSRNTGCTTAACPLQIHGLIDATVGPDKSKLDYGAIPDPAFRSYDAVVTALSQSPSQQGGRIDASCERWHAANEPSTQTRCVDEMHVIRHHLTTPFFVRMALRDSLISGGYIESGLRNADATPMTVASFAQTLHDELATFDTLSKSAEERSAISREPGVFAPSCTNHDTIHDNVETWDTTLTPAGGATVRVLEVFENWKNGSKPSNVLTESPTMADTHCP